MKYYPVVDTTIDGIPKEGKNCPLDSHEISSLMWFLNKATKFEMSLAKMLALKAPITTKVVECSGSVEQ